MSAAAELVELMSNCTIAYRDIVDVQTTCSQLVSAWHWHRAHDEHDSNTRELWGPPDDMVTTRTPACDELGAEFEYICDEHIAIGQFTTMDGVVTIGKLRKCARIVIEMYPEQNDNCSGTVFVAYVDARDDLR